MGPAYTQYDKHRVIYYYIHSKYLGVNIYQKKKTLIQISE